MASHFKWYPDSDEVVVPWNARYKFPSLSSKAEKMTPRIPPKNGSSFAPGQVIRLEFPAQGYINALNTTLEFDATLYGYAAATVGTVRFQNNIQSCFQRVRLLYGSTPLEDIINYHHIVRMLTETTATNQNGTMDQTSIAEGIGGIITDTDGDGTHFGLCNVRQKYIQGITTAAGTDAAAPAHFTGGASFGPVGSSETPAGVSGNGTTPVTRRYQVNLALGLLTQDKLIPTKFMASQLAIEITLAQPAECIFSSTGAGTVTATPTYAIGNVNLIPEILNFDSSYDALFLQGLAEGGVPLKFSSWHTYIGSTKSSTINFQIQERSRSVKALFACQKVASADFQSDYGACHFDTSSDGQSTLQSYQYRIGGR